MDCYHHTSQQHSAAKGNLYPYISAPSLILANTPSPLLLLSACLTKNSSLQPFICLCHVASHPSVPSIPPHPAGQPADINAVGGGTACGWCVGTRWRAPRQGKRIVPSIWLSCSAGPVVQDLACCAALVDASVASPYHVHPCPVAVASALACLATCSFPPANCTLHARPSQRCGPCCKIVHARVRWLGRMGIIEGNERDVHAGLVPRLFLVRQTPHIPLAACLLAATLPAAFLVYGWYHVRYLYEPCANREFPLSRLPYLKKRMAAIVISTAVPRYWVSSHCNTYEKVPLRAR